MSVPAVYTNPNFYPCVGIYTWIPQTPPNIGGLNPTIGFDNLIIDRGAFRNYWITPENSSNILVSSGVGGTNIQGDLYSPIINASRPLNINFTVKKSLNQNAVVNYTGSGDLIIFGDLTQLPGNLSTIQVEYDLSMWLQDPQLSAFSPLSANQQAALASMQAAGVVDSNNLSTFLQNLQPTVIQVIGVDSSGKETEVPLDTTPKGLQITRLRSDLTEPNLVYAQSGSPASGPFFATQTIKIVQEQLNRDAFPLYSKVILRVRSGFANSNTISLLLKKIMFFSADRVNFQINPGSKQLPCGALGYSMYFNGYWFPTFNINYWPQDNSVDTPDVHIKVFSPDYVSNSPGFAHSLNLHLLILAFPTFGPLGDFLLPGVSQPYFGVIVGPMPFTQQLVFQGTSIPSDISSQLAVIPSVAFKASTGSVTLLQNNNQQETLSIQSFSDIVQAAQNFYKTYEYDASGTNSSTQFQNLYTDQFNIQTKSAIYSGIPQRTIQYLQAYEILPAQTINNTIFSYQSYIVLGSLSLYDIFNNSEPCLIFNLQTATALSSSLLQEPGFLSAAINGFVTDPSGLFDTKLIYRIYASQTSDPNSDYARAHTFKITPTRNGPSLSVTAFDSSWDFPDVLISANIESTLQTITTEVIINSTQSEFTIGPGVFNLYCAIYSVSTLNDNIKNYNTNALSSLNFPVINFSIQSNFNLVLPVYYLKSYVNGGNLQAERAFGFTGTYTLDSNVYTVYSTYYSGQSFNNTQAYTGQLNSITGYGNLLVATFNNPGSSTNFNFFVAPGASSSLVVTEVDFALLLENDLENCQIQSGQWSLNIELDKKTTLKNILYKFEIDLVDSITYNLICKVVSSQYSSTPDLTTNITIPFYLPNNDGVLIIRLFVQNSGFGGSVYIDSMALNSNTLGYFQYSQQPITGIRATYYEDLPLQPTGIVGNCNQFALWIDIPGSGSVIFDPSVGMYVDGSIYSPTYIASLPTNMEVDYEGYINNSLIPRASGVEPYQIFFRTGQASSIQVIDTKKHKSTGLIVTLTNQTVGANNSAVYQIVSESYARFFRQQSYVNTVYQNGNLIPLSLQNPTMASGDEILIQGQIQNYQNMSTIALNLESPGTYATQPGFIGQLSPVDNPGYIRTKLTQCPFTAFDYKDNKTYTVGSTQNGNLLYVEDSVISTDQSTQYKLIEGIPTSSELLNQPVIANNTIYYGIVSNAYPGICITKTDDVILFYTYSKSATLNTNTAIYVRIINGGTISSPALLFDFQKYFAQFGDINFSFPSIGQINVVHSDLYEFGQEYYLAFDCAGKIFLMKLFYNQRNIAWSDLVIVYGNLSASTQNTNDQQFIIGLNNMISSGGLNKLSITTLLSEAIYSVDLQNTQRVGVIDFDGIYLGVQFLEGTNVMEVVFDKSYVITGELRQIG